MVLAAAPLLAPNSPASTPSPSPSNPNQPNPTPALVLRLLASEVQRMSKDPGASERFKDAVTQGADIPGSVDTVLRTFSLSTILSHPTLKDLSALERLVFCTPFLTLLFTSTSNSSATSSQPKRVLGLEAAAQIQSILPAALEQLGSPAASQSDLPDLSPLPISKLLSILLSDITTGEREGEGEQVFTDEQRLAIVMATVRGRLGAEVGSQALTHALADMSFNSSSPPSPIAVLSRLVPTPALCSLDLCRAILVRFADLGQQDTEGGGAEMRVAAMLFDLIELAEKYSGAYGGVDLGNWVRAVHGLLPALRWGDVVRAFDSPSRPLPGNWGFAFFAAFLPLSPCPSDPHNPPLNSYTLISAPGGTSAIGGLWSPWANPSIQFSLIDRLLYLPSESFNLPTLASVHRVVTNEDVSLASPAIQALAISSQGSPWNCLELTATLIRLSESQPSGSELASRVHELLERGCNTSPELIMIALIRIEVSRTLQNQNQISLTLTLAFFI